MGNRHTHGKTEQTHVENVVHIAWMKRVSTLSTSRCRTAKGISHTREDQPGPEAAIREIIFRGKGHEGPFLLSVSTDVYVVHRAVIGRGPVGKDDGAIRVMSDGH